jgi:hypothetical protein
MSWMAAATIGAGILGYKGAKDQNAANAQQAANQMAFQERMSNTAHQREVQDLKAAGLNPMLSAKIGGASSPGGAQARMENTSAAGTAAAMNSAQMANLQANTKKTNAEANVIEKTGQPTAEANLTKIMQENVSKDIKNQEAGELLKYRLQKLNFGVGVEGQRFTNTNAFQMKVENEFRQMGSDFNRIHAMNSSELESIKAKSPIIYEFMKFRKEYEQAAANAGISQKDLNYYEILKAADFGGKILSIIGGKIRFSSSGKTKPWSN